MKKPKKTKPKKKSTTELKQANSDVNSEFKSFCEFVPSKRFTRQLRCLFLEFLEYDGSVEAPYLQELAGDLGALFELLDKIEGTRWNRGARITLSTLRSLL